MYSNVDARAIDTPVEVNEATHSDLLKIPGIGPICAKRILHKTRTGNKIRFRQQLVEIGVAIQRAEPFLKINGSYQTTFS